MDVGGIGKGISTVSLNKRETGTHTMFGSHSMGTALHIISMIFNADAADLFT